MVKRAAAFLALFLIIVCPVMAQQRTMTLTGRVSDIDWLGRKLAIRNTDARTGRIDQITVQVPKDAELIRGTRSISFLDMERSDMVKVTYYDDGLSGLKVIRLENLNLGNR